MGLSHEQFWSMSLREFARYVGARAKRDEHRMRDEWQRTAVLSCYVLNSVGGAVSGKKWRTVQPKDLMDRWFSGKSSLEESRDRIRRAKARHKARIERERIRREERQVA